MNYLWFCLLGLFWSGSFLAIKITVLILPPFFGGLLRVAIAQIAFSLLFIVTRKTLKTPLPSLWRLWIIGIFLQGLPFALLFWGESFVSPALASILNSTVATWTLIFSILIFRDYSQATLTKITGLVLGSLGTLVILGPLLFHQHNSNKLAGVIAIMGMAMSYALGGILNQRFGVSKHKVGFQACVWHQHWGSLVFLFFCTLIFEHHFNFAPLLHNIELPLALLYLGVCSTAIAWLIFIHLLFTWGAIRTSTVLYLVPILAILWDYLFLHAAPHVNELLGVVIILTGVSLIQFSKRRPLPLKNNT